MLNYIMEKEKRLFFYFQRFPRENWERVFPPLVAPW